MGTAQAHSHCQEWLGELLDYIDGELEATLCAEIERHLAGCRDCRVMVDTLRRTVTLYRALPETPVPGPVHDRLYKVLKLDDYR